MNLLILMAFMVHLRAFNIANIALRKHRGVSLFANTLQEEIAICMKTSPYLCTTDACQIEIASDISYANDLLRFQGLVEYSAQERDYSKYVLPNLKNSQFNIERIAPISNLRFNVQWNTTFVPENMVGFLFLAGIPLLSIRTTYFNILDRETLKSSFSWEQLFKFVQRLMTTGEMKLPHAVMKGSTELEFVTTSAANPRYTLTKQRESLSLIQAIKSSRLKNRLLVQHLLEYLSCRRPLSVSFEEWEDVIFNKVNYRSVPGMGQFDIDGLDGEQQQDLLSTSQRILTYSTGAVLLLGIALAFSALNRYLEANS